MKGKFAVVGTLALLLAAAGPAAAQEAHRDITLEPGKVLMEVKVPNQRLYDQLYSSYDFVEAVQRNGDGSLSTDILVNPGERALLQAQGVQFVKTLETDAATERRVDERAAAEARESLAQNLAETGSASSGSRSQSAIPLPGEVTIQRAYTFTNYAGRFLYVEAHTKAATPVTPNGVEGSPVMALSFAGADGVFGAASNMPIFRDNMTGINNNNVYMYHRHLVRVTDVEPKHVRVASSAGGVAEAPVGEWVGATRPPHAQGYLTGFFSRYMDPTEITDRFTALAAEFPDIAEIRNLPHLTHGYRRPAQTVMGVPFGAPYAGQTGNFNATAANQAVILESLADGDEGGNDLFATVNNPGVANAPLTVNMTGDDLVVGLATNANGALSSTAAQVVSAINADPAASAKLRAFRYRGVVGTGISQATPRSRLSDFLNAPAHVQRGAVPGEDAADRQAARRLEGRRLHLLPAARARVGDPDHVPRDGRAAAAQLRHRPADEGVGRQPRRLHRPVDQPGRRALLDVRQQQPAPQPGQPLPAGHLPGPAGPQRHRRRPQPQQHDRDVLRQLRRRCRDHPGVPRPTTSARATSTPDRSRRPRWRSRTSTGWWTRSRTSSSRSTSTPTAATSCGRRARTSRPAA